MFRRLRARLDSSLSKSRHATRERSLKRQRRRLLVESLEQRSLMATNVDVLAGSLVVTDGSGVANDAVTMSLSGANVRVHDPGQSVVAGAGASQVDSNTVDVPLATITGDIQVNLLGGDDSLTLNLASGDFVPTAGLAYQGGANNDALVIQGGSQGNVTYNYTNATEGSIVMSNFGTVAYTGLASITNSGTASDITFNLPTGGVNAILEDDGVAANGISRLRSSPIAFEQTDFLAPTGSVTIQGNSGNDTITLAAADSLFQPSLSVQGGGGSDTIHQNASLTLTVGAASLVLAAEQVNVNGSTSSSTATITADDVTIAGAATVSASTSATIQPQTPNRAIDLGTNTAGQLGLTNAELDRITTPTLNLGSTSSGPIAITASITRTAATDVNIVAGANNDIEFRLVGGGSLNTSGGNASITTSGTGRILGGSALVDVTANTLTLTTGPGDASGNAIGVSAASELAIDVNTINVSSGGAVYLSEANSAIIGTGGLNVGGPLSRLYFVSGAFVLGGANRISDNAKVEVSNATLKLNGFDETVARVEGSAGGRVVNDSATLATLTLQENGGSYISNAIFGGVTANENNLALTKNGSALATLSGNNSFTGQVTINAGELGMGHANALGATSGSTVVNSGGSLNLNGFSTSDPLSLSGNGDIGHFGALINNVVTSVLSGAITLTGNTQIAGNGSIQITGVITDGAGTFGLTKFGSGALTLANNNTYDGPTINDGGLFTGGPIYINGSTSSNSQVTIQGGPTSVLGGTGTIGGSVNMLSGRLSPGTSPETLATGSLSFASGTFFDVEIGGTSPGNGVTGYDQVLVTGSVSLGNATLNLLQLGGFTVNSGVLQTFTIIDNDGTSDAVTGTFNGLAEGSAVTYPGGTAYISYAGGDGNDVVLSSQPLVQGTALADDFTVTGNGTTFTVTRTNANGTITATFVNPSPAQLLIQGAGGDDLLTVDSTGLSTDPIPTNGIIYDGQTQDLTSRAPNGIGDILRWSGSNAQTATYLPHSTTNGSGTVTVTGLGSVTFAGLEPVDLTGFGAVNVNFPNGNDNITLTNGNDAATGALAALVVSGTSGGVGFETVHLRSIGTVNIDTTTVEATTDQVTVTSANNAHGISNLSINTGAGTDQIDVNGAITTSNGVSLSSQQLNLTGLISGTGAWTLNLNAGAGSVADLNGVGVNNVSAAGIVNAQATGNIELDTSVNTLGSIQSTAGNVTLREANAALVFNVSASVGDISISSPSGGLAIDTVTASAGLVTINAGTGAITDSGTLNLTANTANLTGGAGINLDTAVNTLTAASTNAAITIRETNGLALNTVNSGSGTTTITLTAGSLTDNNGAGTLNLTAGLAALTAPGGIDLDSAITTLTASSTNSAITVRESNAVALNLIDAGSSTVTITLTAGAITDNNAGGNNVNASQTALTGASGVGTVGDPIETTVGNLEASTGTGGVFIANTGNLTVGGVTGGLTGVSASTSGNIGISTTGTLSLSENIVTSGGAATVTLSATQNVSLPVGTLVQAGTVGNFGAVTVNIDSDNSGGGQLDFAGDIDAASATLNGNTIADTFNITPDQDALASERTPIQVQGFAPTTAPGDVLNLSVTGLTSPALTVNGTNAGAWSFGNAAAVSYVSIETINTSPAITAYDLILDMEPSLTTLDLNGDTIDVRRNGTNLELRVDGTIVFNGDESGIRSLQVLGGSTTAGGNVPNDTLVITETASGLPVFAGVSAAPGSHVTSTFTTLTGYNNAGVPVKIHFDGRGGVNSLQYDLVTTHGVVYTPDNDDTAKSGNVGVATDASFASRELGLSFENLAPLTINGAGGSLVIDASASPSADVTSLAVIGSGVDPVANLNAGTATDGVSVVYPNGSSTTFEPVRFSGFAAATVRSGQGADTIDLMSVDGADPDGAGPAQALTAITLDGDTLTNSDVSIDTLVVRSLPATVTATLLGGQGNDAFNIFNDQGTGGTSDDTVDAILGQVVIAAAANDEGGSDTLTVRDFGDASGDTVTITATTIDGLFDSGVGTDITLNNNIDTVSINTGSSADTVNLNIGGTSNDVDSLTVSGNGGNDSFLIQSDTGSATQTQLNGNADADLFQFNAGAFVLRGGIDGGSQNDLVDWSNYSTARTISLTGLGATDGYTLTDISGSSSVTGSPGSLTNIDAILGTSASDQLRQNFNVRTHWDLGGNVSGFGPYGVAAVNLSNSISNSGVLVADESDISLPLAISPVGQPTGANPITPSAGEQDLAWSGFENLTGAATASDWFDWRNGASLSGTLDGRLGPDTLDYRDFSASVTVDLTAGSAFNVLGGAAGGLVVDATGSSIEHLMGGADADVLVGDIDVNTIRGNDASDTINARDGVDDVDGGAGTDLIQVSGAEAEFDVILGGPGGVEDATDYDILRNVGAGPVTLNGFNLVFDGFANSVDEYDGANFSVIGNGGANELHFGFATIVNTPGLNAGLGNDDVTTSHANVSEVAYDGDVGTDNVTLVLTPDQFGALTTAEIFIVQDFVANPTGKTLSLTAQDNKGNFTATNFETAQIAVYDDDIIVDITACFLAIISEDQIVEGTPGDDTLQGTNLTDLIFGEDGNDMIYGGNASDCIFGGAHNDTLYGENLNDLLVGGSGNDTLYGGDDEDRLFGNSGVDQLFGQFGHDTLEGGLGDDQLDGGNDHDTLNGGPGVDTVQGGAAPDRILIRGAEAVTDIMDGGSEYDTLEIIAGTGTATLQGFSLANTAFETVSSIENLVGNGQILQGNGDANLFDLTGIVGPTGIASIDGLGGNDTLTGSASSDVLNGGDGSDILNGGDGFDVLNGGNDNDTISGGLHNDTINGGAGVDIVSGGDGYDIIQVASDEAENDTIDGGLNTDTIVALGLSPITLNAFNSLTNSIEGWVGNGLSIQGNDNANTLNFQLVGTMTGVPFIDGGIGNDTITGTNGVDNLRGGVGNDTLFGLGGVDTLLGGADNDSLNGGDGIDHLYGEAGADTITTGAGRDIVYFAGDATLTDTITDFALYSDYINLSAYALTYSNLTFFIGVGYREVILPNTKRIRLNGWTRNPTASQFQF